MSNPTKLTPTEDLVIPASSRLILPTIPGFAFERDSKFRPLPDSGPIFVEMNSAGHTRVSRDRIGQIFTTALAGCTGIAAIATGGEDTLAGISHFDALVDNDPRQRTDGACASLSFMNTFMKLGRFIGATEFEFQIAYASMHENEATYGDQRTDFSTWHFLDQLQTFGERNETEVLLHKYEGMGDGHTLVASVDIDAHGSVDFK